MPKILRITLLALVFVGPVGAEPSPSPTPFRLTGDVRETLNPKYNQSEPRALVVWLDGSLSSAKVLLVGCPSYDEINYGNMPYHVNCIVVPDGTITYFGFRDGIKGDETHPKVWITLPAFRWISFPSPTPTPDASPLPIYTHP